jgi:hypothetical protein
MYDINTNQYLQDYEGINQREQWIVLEFYHSQGKQRKYKWIYRKI